MLEILRCSNRNREGIERSSQTRNFGDDDEALLVRWRGRLIELKYLIAESVCVPRARARARARERVRIARGAFSRRNLKC